jgi:hypothetical protein
MGNLVEFLDTNVPSHPGPNFDLIRDGYYGQMLQKFKHDASTESTVLATVLWQILIETAAFQQISKQIGLRPVPWYEREVRVVAHRESSPAPEYDLLVLDRAYRESPTTAQLTAPPDDLNNAFDRWRAVRTANLAAMVQAGRLTQNMQRQLQWLLQDVIDRNFAVAALEKAQFHVLAARMPDLRYTAVPGTPWKVTPKVGYGGFASAGAVVRSQTNRASVGVTIPAHLLLPNGPADPRGWTVDVGGQVGTVVSCDMISDSCFVELPLIGPPNHVTGASAGLLQNSVAPGIGTSGSFEGCATPGKQSGRIRAVNIDVFLSNPIVQQTFDLDCLTNVGDSGCAFLDSSGHILGFAAATTGPMAHVTYSKWIWANSVFAYHKLQPF